MLKLDTMIVKKFDELAEKAKKVNASQQVTDVAAFVDSKKFQDWATAALSLLQKVFGEKSLYYRNFSAIYSKIINIAYKESFDNCRAILQAAREEYEGGGLSEVKLFLDHAVLEFLAAKTAELLRRGEKEAACIMAYVLLEQALQHLCSRKGIAQGSVELMNDALYQAKAYQVGTQQRIKDWGYMKEDFIQCHGEKYRTADVDDMLRGVQRFIAKELEVTT
ncbi:MAG: hypothetical protein A2075_12355 [Geobacteraceae bacterium GWC2_58_44]|nr:MAG: hypothetical protein A2075_12355 [Geobacteraceae bacterium GWC2_58_44]HBG04717.1 hypothetical protein [Geobacter sp.]